MVSLPPDPRWGTNPNGIQCSSICLHLKTVFRMFPHQDDVKNTYTHTHTHTHQLLHLTASAGRAFKSHSGTVSRLTCIQYVGHSFCSLPPYTCIMFTSTLNIMSKRLLRCLPHQQSYMGSFTSSVMIQRRCAPRSHC